MGNQQSGGTQGGHSSRQRAASNSVQRPVSPATTRIDGGFLEPQNHIYSGTLPEYARPVVHQLILERRLPPFYLGLNDHEPEWDVDKIVEMVNVADEQAAANLVQAQATAMEAVNQAEANQLSSPPNSRRGKEAANALSRAILHKERLTELVKFGDKCRAETTSKAKMDLASLYLHATVECPICFLYYPMPQVHTRCCDQSLCIECFVQIKRTEPTPTHLESEPAACPFCQVPDFGVVYYKEERTSLPTPAPPHPRQVLAAADARVITTDQLYPDWQSKLEAIKATVARRANRRVVFRQLGDRLIPVGITTGHQSDGANATMATTTLPPDIVAQVAVAMDAANNNSNNSGISFPGSARRNNRRRTQEVQQYLEGLGAMGQDVEEMMVMEAMRLSLQEDEERKRKQREDERNGNRTTGVGESSTAAQEQENESTSRS